MIRDYPKYPLASVERDGRNWWASTEYEGQYVLGLSFFSRKGAIRDLKKRISDRVRDRDSQTVINLEQK